MEWETVMVGNDFMDVFTDRDLNVADLNEMKYWEEEMNALYVVCTSISLDDFKKKMVMGIL
jgi:hypothetical protein